tara:strand:+ start:164 stop:412 length:249 start_codon:yes stop_codon:yes gene_type:complete
VVRRLIHPLLVQLLQGVVLEEQTHKLDNQVVQVVVVQIKVAVVLVLEDKVMLVVIVVEAVLVLVAVVKVRRRLIVRAVTLVV